MLTETQEEKEYFDKLSDNNVGEGKCGLCLRAITQDMECNLKCCSKEHLDEIKLWK